MHNEGGPGAALERALDARGLAFRVEARGGLAVLTPPPGTHRSVSEEDRRTVLALAREHGFSHAALEIPDGT